jgi:hypothetical protein
MTSFALCQSGLIKTHIIWIETIEAELDTQPTIQLQPIRPSEDLIKMRQDQFVPSLQSFRLSHDRVSVSFTKDLTLRKCFTWVSVQKIICLAFQLPSLIDCSLDVCSTWQLEPLAEKNWFEPKQVIFKILMHLCGWEIGELVYGASIAEEVNNSELIDGWYFCCKWPDVKMRPR